MTATIRDIAQRSGVSYQTVSRILGDKADLHRPSTKQRVLEAARELGYRPNTSAKAMRHGRFQAIALLQAADRNRVDLPDLLVNGIHDELAEHDWHMLVSMLPQPKLTQPGYVPQMLRQSACDGLLINLWSEIPAELFGLTEQLRVPAIWLNIDEPFDCVRFDDERAANEATAMLIGLGHRRIAYVDFSHGVRDLDGHYTIAARMRGYRGAMREAGLEPLVAIGPERVAGEQREAAARELLQQPERPTAVIAYHRDTTGVPVYAAARSLGLEVPRDLTVLAFSNQNRRRLERPDYLPLGALLLPWYDVGRLAARELFAKIEAPGDRRTSRMVPVFAAIDDQSVAPPGAAR